MPPHPLTVVFASVAAGGGHNTVRDALMRAARAADPDGTRVQATSWTAKSGFDRFYRWAVRHGLQGLVYWPNRFLSLSAWLAVLTNPKLVQEAIALLRTTAPDVVVSTHLVLTAAFQVARWWSGAATRVVGIIPDYGAPDPGFFPRSALLRPDAMWVNGEDTFEAIARGGHALPGEVHLLGTLVTEHFTRVREALEAQGGRTPALKQAWRDRLAVGWPQVGAFDVTKPTVAFYGGSGFAGAARPVVDALMARPDAGQRFNVVVLCGRDDELRASLDAAYGARPGFAALGFLDHATLAALYGLTDVPVMGSIAHSSLQELLETATGPLLVYRVIPGTEPPYLDYLARERLGVYEPDTAKMMALVLEAVGVEPGTRWAALADGFSGRAFALRDASRARAPKVLEYLGLVAHRPLLPAGPPVEKTA